MRWTSSLAVRAIGIACLGIPGLTVALARPSDDDPGKAADSKKAVKAKDSPDKPKPEAPKADARTPGKMVEKTVPAKAGSKDGGQITVADWLGVAANAAAAVNELFGNGGRRAVRAPVVFDRAVPFQVEQQFEQQYGARFRQLLRSELHLMRIACQPTRQQYEQIAAEGEKELKATIKKCARMWQEFQQGRHRDDAQAPDARELVATALAKSLKTHLSTEQAARYQQELDLRYAARRRVALSNLVSGMDRKLVLSAEQRDRLREVLDKNWHASWNQSQLLMQGGQYFPRMPDDKILPILSETQKTAWRSIPKGNMYFDFGFQLDWFQGMQQIDDEVWPAAEKRQ